MKKVLLSVAVITVVGLGLSFVVNAKDSKPKKDAPKTEQTCTKAEGKTPAKQGETKSCCQKDGSATSASCGNSSAEKTSSCCSQKKDGEKKECCATKKEK
jgi:hypothetical protein